MARNIRQAENQQREIKKQALPSLPKLRMRGLNAHNTWKSDWDPTTSLMYIVRKDHGLNQTIPPFDPTDEPAIERTESEVRIEIRWLR